MSRLKMISAMFGLAAASIVLPASAHAHDGFGPPVPVYPYAPQAFEYGYVAAPFPYYDRRAEKRAERDYRKHLKRDAKAYKKLQRAYQKYQSRYGYPYGIEYDVGPYRW